ncbi:MAG: hypothetical protein HFG26_10680 [Provencibacterium sp.]|jgi:hypothetical protein|nr:hypothetical protein [Provencibacterium sp.]
MPDFTAHFLLGEELCRRLPEEGRKAALRVPCAFYWGLQGPDPLFYGGPRLSGYGSELHRRDPEKLLRLLGLQVLRAQGKRRDILVSYLLGFLCHYAMDARLHPYIYCLEERLRTGRSPKEWRALHGEIECRMDEELYLLKKKEPILRFRPEMYCLESEVIAALSRLYRAVIYGVLGVRETPAGIAQAFRLCLRVAQLVYTPQARMCRPVLALIERTAGQPGVFSSHIKRCNRRGDILNLRHAAWRNFSEPDTERFDSVPELFEQAVQDAQRLCMRFLSSLKEGHCPQLSALPAFDAGNFKRF